LCIRDSARTVGLSPLDFGRSIQASLDQIAIIKSLTVRIDSQFHHFPKLFATSDAWVKGIGFA
jgi:hypothetical protein